MNEALAHHGAHEMQTASSAAQAAALVQAKYAIAARCPRNEDQFRDDILRACRRRRFAEDAQYARPLAGSTIRGWSIRFVETAARLFRNVEAVSRTIFEDDDRLMIECSVTDLESNTGWSAQVRISKTVERRRTNPNQIVVGTRLNAQGDTVYVVRASDDELNTKVGAIISKTLRTLALRLLPADVLEECEEAIYKTKEMAVLDDPEAERKRLSDAFSQVGVTPLMLASYLGHELRVTTPSELLDLRAKYTALKNGEASWAQLTQEEEVEPAKAPKSERLEKALAAKRKTEPGEDG